MASEEKHGDVHRLSKTGFSVVTALRRQYVERMLEEVNGMKVLVLDPHTTGVISSVISQTDILQKEVYFVELIGARVGGEGEEKKQQQQDVAPVSHLNAVCFLRPTESNLRKLVAHLQTPEYNELHLYFCNILPDGYLKTLAENDEFESIRQIHEFYGDFYPINDDLFSMNISSSLDIYKAPQTWKHHEKEMFARNCEGMVAVLLAAKKRPNIRYQKSSHLCKEMAFSIWRTIQGEGSLFSFRQSDTDPVLLILDRRDDPVTPLLSQWTYQAMVHELLGIDNSRIDMSKVPKIRPDLKQIVLNSRDDEFYDRTKFLNFGDLGEKVKQLVDLYQQRTKSNKKISSIEEMQKFVEDYPEFIKQSGHVSKHVAVMSELSRQVEERQLMEVSALEQNLACTEDHSRALEEIHEHLAKPNIPPESLLKLVMLYSLRYEDKIREINEFKAILRHKFGTANQARVSAIDHLFEFAGGDKREGDLFLNKNFFRPFVKAIQGIVQGVENIYTQHTPRLASTVDQLLRGRLRATEYPSADGRASRQVPRVVFIYIVGGCTYEEAAYISSLNAENSTTRIILGGSTVHNSKSFIDDVCSLHKGHVGLDVNL